MISHSVQSLLDLFQYYWMVNVRDSGLSYILTFFYQNCSYWKWCVKIGPALVFPFNLTWLNCLDISVASKKIVNCCPKSMGFFLLVKEAKRVSRYAMDFESVKKQGEE